jgi:hypothetical protein
MKFLRAKSVFVHMEQTHPHHKRTHKNQLSALASSASPRITTTTTTIVPGHFFVTEIMHSLTTNTFFGGKKAKKKKVRPRLFGRDEVARLGYMNHLNTPPKKEKKRNKF